MDLIREIPKTLDLSLCNAIIERFEEDERKHPGVVAGGRVDPSVKDSLDLKITGLEDWGMLDQYLTAALREHLQPYLLECYLQHKFQVLHPYDTGFQIQKTWPGCTGYVWHHDFAADRPDSFRAVTFIWYLNGVKEGGETEFICGRKVHPEAGKLLLFPATWTMTHRGNPPISGDKYIATGWLYSHTKP